MASDGSSRSSPLSLSGGPYTPAQRAQLERQYINTLYSGDFGPGWTWQWVETRTFPDNGHTYDVVGFMEGATGYPPVSNHNELWFDVTGTLTSAEASPLIQRATSAPVVNPSGYATSNNGIRPAGQVSSDGTTPVLITLGILAAFMVIEYATRSPASEPVPSRPKQRRSVRLPV